MLSDETICGGQIMIISRPTLPLPSEISMLRLVSVACGVASSDVVVDGVSLMPMAAMMCLLVCSGPAAHGHGGARSAVGIVPKRSGGSVIPGAMAPGRVGSGGSGAGGVRQGVVPLGIGSQQDVRHGCFRGRSGCSFCCFLSGFVACRRRGRQTCRVSLVMVRGQFRFGHRSPWMAAATMAARLHSSSTASARITASMARSSPIHHSM